MKLSKLGLTVGVAVYIVLGLTSTLTNASKCSICTSIVENFKEGLDKTKKSNFGGGNTRWEEKSLGAWAHSETRLVEIWDNYLCKHDSKECHMLLEKHEEDVEEYWFKVHAKDENVDMNQWLCISKLKVCCPPNRYGPTCKECKGGKDRPCMGNGKCDGNGTREGTGKCNCDSGYQGDICDECTDGYFEESKNDSHAVCTKCDESCQSTCWEGGPKGCDECKSGWELSDNEGCVDIDECMQSPCDENQYCVNTPGKHNCFTCHRACNGCTAYGATHCESCGTGYRQENDICADINECTEDTTLCAGEKQSCKNTDGSYECECEGSDVYDISSQQCIPKPKDDDETSSPTNDKQKEEL